MYEPPAGLALLPQIDRLLTSPECCELLDRYGREATRAAIRACLGELRRRLSNGEARPMDTRHILSGARSYLEQQSRPTLRRVFNLSGTVLHTNLGRACLPARAIAAMARAARHPCNLEYDLETARRGDRDCHVEELLVELTGAEAATVVNNNAAAVLLALNSIALRKEVLVSRGELIEIGGSFRMPDIMLRAGCRLREIGTTNRTHVRDYRDAIGKRTAAIMKVHASNFRIAGFTAAVSDHSLAQIAQSAGLVFVIDLGSGSLVDLDAAGLPHEPTAGEAIAAGADLVTFSGDKLLGGPQAGIIVGRRELVAKLKSNPLRRALRVDKMTLAALSSVLQLYRNPDTLARELPTLQLLTRPPEEIRALAESLLPAVHAALGTLADVTLVDCQSEVGSGALPTRTFASVALRIRPRARSTAALDRLRVAFRGLPVPVIGYVQKGALLLDLRALRDVETFRSQLPLLQSRTAG